MAWLPLPGPLSEYRQHQQEFNKGMFSQLLGMQIQKHLKEQDMENEMQRFNEQMGLKREQMSRAQANAAASAAAGAQKQSAMQALLSQFMGGQQPQSDDMLSDEGGSIRPPSLQFAHSPGVGGVPSPDASLPAQGAAMAPPSMISAAMSAQPAREQSIQVGPAMAQALETTDQVSDPQTSQMPPEQAQPQPSSVGEQMFQRYKRLNPIEQVALKQAFKSQFGFVPFGDMEKLEEKKQEKEMELQKSKEIIAERAKTKQEQDKIAANKLTTRARSDVQRYFIGSQIAPGMLDRYADFIEKNAKELPSQISLPGMSGLKLGQITSPDIQSDLNRYTAGLAEALINAQGLQKSDAALKDAHMLTTLQPRESPKHFANSLRRISKELKARSAGYKKALTTNDIAHLPEGTFLSEPEDNEPGSVTEIFDPTTGKIVKIGGAK